MEKMAQKYDSQRRTNISFNQSSSGELWQLNFNIGAPVVILAIILIVKFTLQF